MVWDSSAHDRDQWRLTAVAVLVQEAGYPFDLAAALACNEHTRVRSGHPSNVLVEGSGLGTFFDLTRAVLAHRKLR